MDYKNPAIDFNQHTLNKPFTCIGVGLHTGIRSMVTVSPAKSNYGFRFTRKDLSLSHNEVIAAWHTVKDTHLGTTVANAMGVRVMSVEHLLAALAGAGIDNAHIDIYGPEVPVIDGSAETFTAMIQSVGRKKLPAERKAIVIQRKISVSDGDRAVALTPATVSSLELQIDFGAKIIGRQKLKMTLNPLNFETELAKARTFGFADQLKTLRELGYANGATLKNAILVDDKSIVNPEGLWRMDEFVRHKALDCVGDLALMGAPILGHFKAKNPGHTLNHRLLQELVNHRDSYRYISLRRFYLPAKDGTTVL